MSEILNRTCNEGIIYLLEQSILLGKYMILNIVKGRGRRGYDLIKFAKLKSDRVKFCLILFTYSIDSWVKSFFLPSKEKLLYTAMFRQASLFYYHSWHYPSHICVKLESS